MAAAPASDSEEDNDFAQDESNHEAPEDTEPSLQQLPCKYYNKGRCREGRRCLYLHVCMYALKGHCRYGDGCKLNHCIEGGSSPVEPTPSATKLTDGRPYQWQLRAGGAWMDVSNDHVIEAQYSLPHRKSIKMYNTNYGAVKVVFTNMRVEGTNLSVRRLDDGNTEWMWFMLKSKWMEYGEEDTLGSSSPVKSSDIEEKFQVDPKGSSTFTDGDVTFEINFRDMRHKSQNLIMRVTRRPRYREKTTDVCSLTPAFQQLSTQSRAKWQFEGDRGKWFNFKNGQASISSDDIEMRFQQNPQDSMTFSVGGQMYKLDLKAKTQTNLKTRRVRSIRRVLV